MKKTEIAPHGWYVNFIKKHFEIFILVVFSIVWLLLLLIKQLPFMLPDSGSGAFAYEHYIVPLLAAFLVQLAAPIFISRIKNQKHVMTNGKRLYVLLYIPFFIAIVFFHFNFKGWMPLINPNTYDDLYARIDEITPFARWLTMAGIAININNSSVALYHQLFVVMFLVSMMAHAMLDNFTNFRKVIVGTSLVLLLGSLSYWIMPAIGPFIYRPPEILGFYASQERMLSMYKSFLSTGIPPAGYFTSPPAAMPSLHVANSFFFLLMAKKSLKILYFVFIPFCVYFIIIAVASGWHYFIDLPFGIVLALLCVFIVDRVYGKSKSANTIDKSRVVNVE